MVFFLLGVTRVEIMRLDGQIGPPRDALMPPERKKIGPS